jgi:hypothetical protein
VLSKEALLDILIGILGKEPAETLMTYLPPERPATESQVLENGRRIDGMSTRLDGVEARLDGVEARLDRVETRLDRIEDRLDDLYRAVIDQTTTLTVAITAQARQFMLTTVGAVVSTAGLAFVAARFGV